MPRAHAPPLSSFVLAMALAAATSTAACGDEERRVRWRVAFEPEALAARADVVEGRIRAGGCDGPRIVYEDEVGSGARPVPALASGRYGFEARARDAACAWYALDCVDLTLPLTEGAEIRNAMTALVPEEPACDRTGCPACGGDDGGVDGGPDAGPFDAGPPVCPLDCGAPAGGDFGTAGVFSLEVPATCVTLSAKVWGGGGGHGADNTLGAAGGFASATVDVTGGESLQIVVGGGGRLGVAGVPGGGGEGGTDGADARAGGGGGGYSGIFRGVPAMASALIVAGGGAGSGAGAAADPAGGGGGLMGQAGTDAASAGTQTAAGAPVSGGAGGVLRGGDGIAPAAATERGGGGGGGGWFGGGGGGALDPGPGDSGGGGSGFVIGSARERMLFPAARGLPHEAPGRDGAAAPQARGRVLVECR